MEDNFTLPERWCICWGSEEKFKVIQGYLETIKPKGWNYYLQAHSSAIVDYDNGYHGYGWKGKIPDGLTEITYEQFVKYVLNKEPEVINNYEIY